MRSITNLFGAQTVKILLIYIWNLCILDVYDVMISYILLSLLAASSFWGDWHVLFSAVGTLRDHLFFKLCRDLSH